MKSPDRITDAVKRSALQNAIAGKPVRRRSSAMRLSRNTSIGVTPFCESPYRTNSVRFFNFISNRVQIQENSFCVKSGFLCLRTFLFVLEKNTKKEAQGEENVSWQSQPPRPAPAAKGFFILTQKITGVNAFSRKAATFFCVLFSGKAAPLCIVHKGAFLYKPWGISAFPHKARHSVDSPPKLRMMRIP